VALQGIYAREIRMPNQGLRALCLAFLFHVLIDWSVNNLRLSIAQSGSSLVRALGRERLGARSGLYALYSRSSGAVPRLWQVYDVFNSPFADYGVRSVVSRSLKLQVDVLVFSFAASSFSLILCVP
jgi:hypothetical protein